MQKDIHAIPSISAIARSADFESSIFPEEYVAFSKKLGLDVSEVVRVAQHIPLILRGTSHQESRKRLAVLIAEGARRARTVTEVSLPVMVSGLLRPGSHDVMADFVNPFVNKIVMAMVGIELQVADDTLISRVFSRSLGVSKRRRVNAELKSLRTQIEAKMPDLTETEVGDRLALCVLGTDPLRGTLGCSLHKIFSVGSSHTIDAVSANYPLRTAVPFVEREAIRPVDLEAQNYAAGTTFKVWLDSYESEEDSKSRMSLFGFGAHTCLGRKLSLEIWKMVTDALRQNPASVDVVDYALRRDDVFRIPEKFRIEVSRV